MAKIGYYTADMSEDQSTYLLSIKNSLDALILDLDPFFRPQFIDVIKEYTDSDIPVFIITGQRGQYEQQKIRELEKAAVRVGAIPLGAPKSNDLEMMVGKPSSLKHSAPGIIQGINKIFDTDNDIATKIALVQQEFYHPAIEANEFVQLVDFLFDGGSIDIGKFAYSDYRQWLKLKKSERYKPLSKAATASFTGIAPDIIEEMGKRNLDDYYSMGPGPCVDKKILEAFVRAKKKVKYHAIDISVQALFENERIISEHLDSVNKNWRKYVEIVSEKPKLFSEVKTDKSCCVAYPGAQLSNNEELISEASDICQEGGLLVADVHRRYEEGDSDFWLHIYDDEIGKDMFRKAIGLIAPDMISNDDWKITMKYIKNGKGHYKISIQLDVDKEIETDCNLLKVILEPGKTRELMISKKYTLDQIKREVASRGYSLIKENSVPIELPTDVKGRGSVTTTILEYKTDTKN